MTGQIAIDDIRSKQGTFRTIDPNFLSDKLQAMYDSSEYIQAVYLSSANLVPSVSTVPSTLIMDSVIPQRNPPQISIDPVTGFITFLANGQFWGSLVYTAGSTTSGQDEDLFFWAELKVGEDLWFPYGFSVRESVSKVRNSTVSTVFASENMEAGDVFMLRFACTDVSKGVGFYTTDVGALLSGTTPAPSLNPTPNITPSIQFNVRLYEYR